MKGPEDIKKKALNWYNKASFRSNLIFGDESEFPLFIPLSTPSSRELLDNFPMFSKIIDKLEKKSKEKMDFGYHLCVKEITSRSLGKQSLPHSAMFDNLGDFLKFLGKEEEFKQMQRICEFVINEIPQLSNLLRKSPDLMEIDLPNWKKLVSICKFFSNNPNDYLRSLEIKDVDSKFIEKNKKLISILLDETLPKEHINLSVLRNARHWFEKRYGLKYDLPQIRFRILDEDLRRIFYNFSDLQVTLDNLEKIEIPCQKIIIAENKVNGLVLPDLPSTIAIFGLGNGVGLLKNIKWLNKKKVAYWGDIDTWGFSILSNLRKHFPHIQSLLMDRETFKRFEHLAVGEPNKAEISDPTILQDDERSLYKNFLKKSPLEKTRLEQEKIPLSYCLHHIHKWVLSCHS